MNKTGLTPWLEGKRRLAVFLACLVAGAGLGLSGGYLGVEREIGRMLDSLRSHPASGTIEIVEIDARSIASIDRWPWPRRNHAALIDKLTKAGVASIAFDVDFSSQSDPAGDAALAAALGRAGGTIALPTFRQAAGGGAAGFTDSLPADALRRNAVLAAVSIRPDDDGYVREAPLGTITSGVPRPSLSAMVAQVSGAAGEAFPIDFSIEPSTIPRHSFIDIRDGRFDPAALRGKRIIVGATAIELGDRYAVPRHGVIPGVVIQALASETLLAGTPVVGSWLILLVCAAGAAWMILGTVSRRSLLASSALSLAGVLAAAGIARAEFGWVLAVTPALVVLSVSTAAAMAMRLYRRARFKRLHDPETGLPNRLALYGLCANDADVAIAVGRITEYDRLSAALGADLVAGLVRRIRDRVALVTDGDTVFRTEDRVLAWRAHAEDDITEERFAALRAAMLSPVEVAGKRVDVSLVFGLARGPGSSLPQIVADASLAADQAIASGTRWHVHHAEEKEGLERELSLLGELDDAIRDGNIEVLYQPKLALATNHISSVEALVRWNHPVRGLLRPDLFIPLAERNDRIGALTLHVLSRTIADVKAWAGHGHEMVAAINLSANLVADAAFSKLLRKAVESSGIRPEQLIFEITESAAMADPEGAAKALQQYRALGIGISMDDYGTGQSTLTYIKRLPLTELKIDRSFVQFAHQDRGDAVLVRSTIDLAHELGLKVVAEGVEDEACLAFLRSVNCDMAQGYLIGRPAPPAEIVRLLSERRLDAA